MKFLLITGGVTAVAGLVAWSLRRRDRPPRRSATPPVDSNEDAQPSGSDSLGALLSKLRLEPRDTGFFGLWEEGSHDGCRIAIQSSDGTMSIFAGPIDADREQISEIYMGRVSASSPLPIPGSGQRLDRFVGPEGRPIAERYFLWATGCNDYPALRIPEVRDALLALSAAVTDVHFYVEGGLQLELDLSQGSDGCVERDVESAVMIARALERSQLPLSAQ